jgi:AraC-like DNA-binding protein
MEREFGMHTQRGTAIHGGESSVGLAPGERVAALLATAAARAHLCDALGGSDALLTQCDVREHLDCVESGVVALSVVEITHASAGAHVSLVRRLREGFPSIPVLAYCDPSGGTSGLIVDVVRAGATGLVLRGIDDSRVMLREAIRGVRRKAIAEQIFAEIGPLLTNDARIFLRYAIEHSSSEATVEDAARDLGVDRKTLTNWLARAGAPRAREFLAWVRLIVAGHLLGDPMRTAEQAALVLDFPSGTSLRNMLRRYVGATATEVQQGGGARLVLDAFKRELRTETVVSLPTDRRLVPGLAIPAPKRIEASA